MLDQLLLGRSTCPFVVFCLHSDPETCYPSQGHRSGIYKTICDALVPSSLLDDGDVAWLLYLPSRKRQVQNESGKYIILSVCEDGRFLLIILFRICLRYQGLNLKNID